MRLLFLAKRHPQQRDLLARPYGRFLHLPAGLAARGHEVHVGLLSHRGLPGERREHSGVLWFSGDLRRPIEYRRAVLNRLRSLKPDWIVGGSDLYYGLLAAHWGPRFGARVAIDAYDNFESYLPRAWPLHRAWRAALGRADLITAPGPQLLARLAQSAPRARAAIVPMAADPGFQPMDRASARARLGLPPEATLIGYCGSLFPGRGAEVLFDALTRVARVRPGVQLIATGRVALTLPPGVHHLGYLPDADVPAFLCAVDVAVVTAEPNDFGSFAYPAKLCEARACGRPLVASDVEPIRWMLGGDRRSLAAPGDPAALADRILAQLAEPRPLAAPAPWAASVDALEAALDAG